MNRVSSPKELYGPGYRWDGACTRCGEHGLDFEGWKGGYRLVCACCGHWECVHNAGGTEAVHTADGLWYARRKGATAPLGCPWLRDAGAGAAQDTPRSERPLEGPSNSTASDLGGGVAHRGRGSKVVKSPARVEDAGSQVTTAMKPANEAQAQRVTRGLGYPARRPLDKPGVESHDTGPSVGIVAQEGVGVHALAPSTG